MTWQKSDLVSDNRTTELRMDGKKYSLSKMTSGCRRGELQTFVTH